MTAMSPHNSSTDQTSAATSESLLDRAANYFSSSKNNVKKPSHRTFPRLPLPSQERLDASQTETPLEVGKLSQSDISAAEEKGKTVLYLAYGSNLCNETFRGNRGIRPLSQINVLVPSLRLTFDLPGIPYHEPCFANSANRDPESDTLTQSDYHKDRWHKGMVGCVYEVTPSDYAHIIATEGGGSSYQDILVTCYPLPADSDTVPSSPTTAPFKAHTLFATISPGTPRSRPDPSYAQPSARYLKLITDGAAELNLPQEYQVYLNNIRAYTITSKRQEIAHQMVLKLWWPFIMALFVMAAKLQDKKGRSPKWVGVLTGWVMTGMWSTYDMAWKKMFGDGERTEGDTKDFGKRTGGKVDENGSRKSIVGMGIKNRDTPGSPV